MLGKGVIGKGVIGGRIGGSSAPISINTPSNTEVIANEVRVSGSTNDAGAVEYRVDGGSWATLATPSGGLYSGTIIGLVAGARTLSVRQSATPANTASVSVTVVDDACTLVSPVAYQLIPRHASARVDIAVTVTLTGVHPAIEARFNRGGSEPWQSFAQTSTTQTITLANERRGTGTIEVRASDNHALTASATPVSVGRLITILGQSNAAGRGTNNQTAPASDAYLYDVAGTWHALADPTNGLPYGGTVQYSALDDIAQQSGGAGSWAVPLAAAFVAAGEPCAVLNNSVGGAPSASFLPSTLTTTGYGAFRARSNAAGGPDFVVWHQGEAEIDSGTSTFGYQSNLTSIIDYAIGDWPWAKFAVNLLAYKKSDGASNWTNIHTAQVNCATTVNRAIAGGDVAPYEGLHLTTNSELSTFGAKVFAALLAEETARVVEPGTAHLVLTGYAPTVGQTNNIGVQPGTAHLVLTGYAPTISVSGAPAVLSGAAVLEGITAGGNIGVGSGTLTTPVLKNNTGTILASVSGIVANIYHPTTGALVVRKTGLTSNGAGIVTISDALLVTGTTYVYELDLSASSQGRRLPTGVAA